MTDRPGNAIPLAHLFARRMAVEEPFRNTKDGRYGLGLGQTQATTTGRLDRLILIVALALIRVIGLGLVARDGTVPGAWCSSNDPTECSDGTVGRRMWDHIDYYLSSAPVGTPVPEFARVTKAAHRVEECLKRAKGEAGLADYQVRTWAGWHHHQALSLIAAWFLAGEVRRGKKEDPGVDCPAVGGSDRGAAEAAMGR